MAGVPAPGPAEGEDEDPAQSRTRQGQRRGLGDGRGVAERRRVRERGRRPRARRPTRPGDAQARGERIIQRDRIRGRDAPSEVLGGPKLATWGYGGEALLTG